MMDQNDHGIDYNSIPLPEEPAAPRQTKHTKKQAAEGTPVASTSGGGTVLSIRKPRLTINALSLELKQRNIEVRFNELNKTPEISGNKKLDYIVTMLNSELGDSYSNANFEAIGKYIGNIAIDNSYNPVIEHFDKLAWDKKSRLPEVYAILAIPESDWLSRTLIKKWLLQCVAMLYNRVPEANVKNAVQAYGAEGVLTLQGAQGAGKTTFLAKLGMNWFYEGAKLNDNDKDTFIQAHSYWITELGEVETSLNKSSAGSLKSFITQNIDRYRMPYGKSYENSARLTSLCATCNGTTFLKDQTGNRRWFVVPIGKKLDYEEIQKLDVEQLWAELFEQVRSLSQKERAACFRLTANEMETLERRNKGFKELTSEEAEVKYILDEANANPDAYEWCDFTTSEWIEEFPTLKKFGAAKVGRALSSLNALITSTRNNITRRSLPRIRPIRVPKVVNKEKVV